MVVIKVYKSQYDNVSSIGNRYEALPRSSVTPRRNCCRRQVTAAFGSICHFFLSRRTLQVMQPIISVDLSQDLRPQQYIVFYFSQWLWYLYFLRLLLRFLLLISLFSDIKKIVDCEACLYQVCR